MVRDDALNGFDVAVAGGGPAGSAAATLLARAGARVALVDAGTSTRRLEGAGQRLVAALRSQRFACDGIGPAMPRQADWGAMNGAPNIEHPVLRPVFDAALRAQAADEGVAVMRGNVRRAGGGRIDLTDGREVRAGLVIEARGRRAPVGPGRVRGPATVAIGGWSAEPGSGSGIIARESGWAWTIGSAEGTYRQATVDAALVRHGLRIAWSSLAAALDGAPFPTDPFVRATELRLAAPELDPALLRIGDAAVAMDPLCGHGLYFAFASALHAVPLARAIVDGETALARQFYTERVVGTFHRQARIGRDFHRMSGFHGPFWATRAAWPDAAPAERSIPACPYLGSRAIVRHGRLRRADVLFTPQEPEGVAFVRGREIAKILDRIRGALPDRAAFAAHILPEVPPEEAGLIHDWLRHRGVTSAGLSRETEATP